MPLNSGLWTAHADGEVLLRLSRHGPGHETPVTIPELFRESVSRFGTYPALVSKSTENWEILNFNQYYEACRKAARALIKIPQSSIETLKAIIQYKLPMNVHNKDNLYSWDDFMELGNSIPNSQLDQIIAGQKANQCAVLMYTSGTTGNPKGVMLSHDNVSAGSADSDIRSSIETLKAIIQYKLPMNVHNKDNLYSWDDFMELGNSIPNSQLDQIIAGQKANQCAVLMYTSGTTGNPKGVMLSHDNGTLVDTLQEVKPTIFLGVPRIWEKMQERIKENGTRDSQLKKKVFSWARAVGLKINKKKMLGIYETPVTYQLAKALVFSKVRSALGLERCRFLMSGAGFLGPDTSEFFLSLDIPVGEMYGLSESSGPHTAHSWENYRILRKAFDGEVIERLFGSSELLKLSGCPCRHLSPLILGKAEVSSYRSRTHPKPGFIPEIIITASGENVSPGPIENMIKKKIPILSHAMLVGDKAKFLSILLTLKCETDSITGEPLDKLNSEAIKFCQSVGSQATTVTEIVVQHDLRVYAAIQRGIDAANQEANSGTHRVQKWVILEKDFSIWGGELGPTTKMKRYFITQKYKKQIENFYQ
ncbi:long-chain-fatty-acid--CoA ligase ACSBG2 [Pteropus vampyrus]|uniref:Long-chain-fatty-acid--CoA ligase ACSBG2 n=1 Tax=Pteropus vampyrus TaxID=132908 RepID=A0A6P6D407_PTEVA|nr:long-chain-fatty-acid--CoA ligase ACSBG2 [Pteropus vampyrus]